MQNSILLIDKPANMTSFGVVARIRRVMTEQLEELGAGALRTPQKRKRHAKVGHCGTLDPFATGLMIIVTGTECKNAGAYTKLDKVYEATFRLGATSTTGDPEGEISERDILEANKPEKKDIDRVLNQFTGVITQTPPIFSAIKINGQRAYNLARKGQAVDMPKRQVTVYSLELISYQWPNLQIRTHVSSGTYIRSLAEDIGEALSTGAYCTQLRRTKIADWDIANAQTLTDFGVH